MTEPHRATPEQWASQKAWAVDDDDSACLIDLHARVEALEAAQLEQAESHRFCTDAIVRRVEALEAGPDAHWRPLHFQQAQVETTYDSGDAQRIAQELLKPRAMVVRGSFEHGGKQFSYEAEAMEAERPPHQDKLDRLIALDRDDPTPDAAMTEPRAPTEALEADQRYQFRSDTEKVPTTRLYSYSVGPAKPLDELGQGHTLVSPEPASAEARPAASEIFPVEYADANGEGIRIIMEPADETGRVCWVVRNSRRVCPIREFPTPEAAYAAH
jgi:hypothetical protein